MWSSDLATLRHVNLSALAVVFVLASKGPSFEPLQHLVHTLSPLRPQMPTSAPANLGGVGKHGLERNAGGQRAVLGQSIDAAKSVVT
jgi:hypothetical protein